MSRYFSFLLFIAYSSFAQIKDDTLLYDDFTDNGMKWYTNNETNYYIGIENGMYECKYSGTWTAGWFGLTQVDYNKDLTIESTITTVDGGEMGLIWAAKDVYSAYFFTTKGNQVSLYTYDENATKKVLGSATLKKKTPTQVFKVEKKGNTTTCYINGEKVFKATITKFPGLNFGFAMVGTTHFKADKIFVKNQRTINLAPNIKPTVLENLGPAINTPYNEYIPVLTQDGKGLYFIGSDNPNNMGGPEKEDIYYSEFTNGAWSKAKNIGAPLNNKSHNGVFSVSPDQNTLLLLNRYNSDGTMSSGVSISHRDKNGWSTPVNQTLKDFQYGEYGYTDYFLSPDGRVLLLAVEGKGEGLGERDLHVSFLQGGGNWSKPVNMGSVLNTIGDEQAPCLAADGVTLYFASDGHPGFGNADIFMTKRLDNSWMKWSKPVNLGRPINSRGYDGYYTVPASGEFAFLASSREKKHGSDIYKVKIQKEIKPDPVLLVRGKVLNILDNTPIYSIIHYEDLRTHKEIGTARTDYNHAEYKIVLPYGEHIGVRAEAEGFIPVSESFDIKEKKNYQEVTKNLYMMPISQGKKMSLNNVFFVQSKPELLPISYPELDRLADILIKNKKIQIMIHGHTDNQGNPKDNLKLSEDRVNAVKAYLVSKGVDEKRIKGQGHGGTLPIAPNDKEENRKLNRRVEFEITKI